VTGSASLVCDSRVDSDVQALPEAGAMFCQTLSVMAPVMAQHGGTSAHTVCCDSLLCSDGVPLFIGQRETGKITGQAGDSQVLVCS